MAADVVLVADDDELAAGLDGVLLLLLELLEADELLLDDESDMLAQVGAGNVSWLTVTVTVTVTRSGQAVCCCWAASRN